MKFSVLIVDDQELVRKGLSHVLEQHFPDCEIYFAASGEEAMNVLESFNIHIMLLDIGLPGMSGLDVARYVIQNYKLIKVLVVTQYNGEALIQNLIQAGVHSFFLKSEAAAEIKNAIEAVMDGKDYIPDELRKMVNPAPTTPSVVFTKREAEILVMLKMGRSSREISEWLGLKENTVNSYREDMLNKTKTSNVAQLISFAYENGILR